MAEVEPHEHPVDPGRVARARAAVPESEAADAAATLSLLADVTRLRLVMALRAAGELCVGDLALALSVSDDAVGYGLRLLRAAGLVSFRKEGRVVFYRLSDGFPERLLDECLGRLARLTPSSGAGAR